MLVFLVYSHRYCSVDFLYFRLKIHFLLCSSVCPLLLCSSCSPFALSYCASYDTYRYACLRILIRHDAVHQWDRFEMLFTFHIEKTHSCISLMYSSTSTISCSISISICELDVSARHYARFARGIHACQTIYFFAFRRRLVPRRQRRHRYGTL